MAAALAGCGGGGGGGPERVSASFDPPSLAATAIEGTPTTVSFRATVDPGGRNSLYLGLAEALNVVVDSSSVIAGNTMSVTLTLSPRLAPGVHSTQVELLACADAACREELPGSPMRVPLRFEVLPQIHIQPAATMSRSGQEAAPAQTLALSVPAAAGAVLLETQGDSTAIGVQIQGNQLVVQTRQVPAGNYRLRATVRSQQDSGYSASVDLSYLVNPPAGGEHGLSVSQSSFTLDQTQGTRLTHRFRVIRPTWTDVLDPVTIFSSDNNVVRDLRSLGNDEYEFITDTTGLSEAGPSSSRPSYSASILVRAGELGGTLGISVDVRVNPPVLLGDTALAFRATAVSTAADLQRTTTVSAPDGAAVRWTASSNQPWLQLSRSSGTTGVDDLQLRVDPAALNLPGPQQEAQLSVAVDRPGTLPSVRTVIFQNQVPSLERAFPGVLTDASAKVYLEGRLAVGSNVLQAGVVTVSGATLRAVTVEEDPRYVGFMGLLAVSLDGVVPGQAVTIRVNAPLRASSITLPSLGAPRVAAGYAALPYGSYRPPSFAPGGQALYFAGTDTVWRWALGAGAWGSPQAQALPGLVDATVSRDESAVFALAGTHQVLALDPTSLSSIRQGRLRDDSASVFDTSADRPGAALRFAADGRAFAGLRPGASAPSGSAGSGWLTGISPATGQVSSDLASSPGFGDPGANYLYDTTPTTRAVALAASADGGALVTTYPSGRATVYRGIRLQRQDLPSLPAGNTIVSVDNAAAWLVRDDGRVQQLGVPLAHNLAAAAGAGFTAGGFAVSGNADLAAMYAYRVVTEATGPRARDARILLFDLRGGMPGLGMNGAPYAQVDLPEAVGCTAALASGETCEHRAHVLVAPGGRSVFVLGPRGVAAVALPDLPTSTAATQASRKGLAQRMSTQPAARPHAR